jgi:hypothetical protein
MSRVNQFKDPLEGKTPKGELEWWSREIAGAPTPEQKAIIEHNRKKIDAWAVGWQTGCFIGCWHMNTAESAEMWGLYTTKPESIVVRTTYEMLRACLPAYVEMGVVRYIDYAKDRLPTMNMFEYVMHKDSPYQIEQEVRIVGFPPVVGPTKAEFEASLFESEKSPGVFVYAPPVDLRRLIHGVILHPKASGAYEARVADLCRIRGLPDPLRSGVTL